MNRHNSDQTCQQFSHHSELGRAHPAQHLVLQGDDDVVAFDQKPSSRRRHLGQTNLAVVDRRLPDHQALFPVLDHLDRSDRPECQLPRELHVGVDATHDRRVIHEIVLPTAGDDLGPTCDGLLDVGVDLVDSTLI